MAENQVKIISSFGPLVNKPICTVTDYSKDKDIVEYVEEKYIEKTGEADTDYIEKVRIVEGNRVNRAKYIASFADDVGIQNILKKIRMTGDESLLNQCKGQFLDTTGLPSSKEDAYAAVENGVKAFDDLPDELKRKMSMADFVNYFGQEQFDEFINGKVAAILAAKEKKGEDK